MPILLLLWTLGLLAGADVDAKRIDALIDADLIARGVMPEPICDDATFLRRAWIDLGGRIPTVEEATAFLADNDPAKRSRLIRDVATTPAWAMAQFTWLADILRVQSRLQDRNPGQPWIDWLWKAVNENRPWDQLASQMLTATGDVYGPDGGATGFIMRDAGMPLDHAAITAQTFLGTRIGCAQCHDHPFDSWTRLDFLRFAAFSADTRTAQGRNGLKNLKELNANATPQVRNASRTMALISGAHVDPPKKPWLPVPEDYQYQDAKQGDRIAAAALFPPAVPVPAKGDARQALAAWMTSPQNPRFALAIGNRLWKRLFGTGLIEPVDDVQGDPSKPLPALQAALVQLVLDCHFDLRQVEVALCSSQHWQRRQWVGEAPPNGGVTPGRPAIRLSATAWWDSIVTLCAAQPDARSPIDAKPLLQLHDTLHDADAAALIAAAERLVEVNKAGGRGASSTDPEMEAVAEVLRGAPRQKQANQAKGGGRKPRDQVLRAAALPQPAPLGHPLRTLGESDRELISNSSDQPTVPQALLVMNGIIDSEVLAKGSRLMRELSEKQGADQIEHLWLATLSRRPSAAELTRAGREITSRGQAGLADVIWALLNGDEFRIMP